MKKRNKRRWQWKRQIRFYTRYEIKFDVSGMFFLGHSYRSLSADSDEQAMEKAREKLQEAYSPERRADGLDYTDSCTVYKFVPFITVFGRDIGCRKKRIGKCIIQEKLIPSLQKYLDDPWGL